MIEYLVACLLMCTTSASVAPFITKCKWDDSTCLKSSTQTAIPLLAKGIPELGVHSLDPMYMKNLDASSSALKLYLKDISGTGLKDCIAKKVQRDISKSKLFIKLQCTVDFKGQYEMSGRLLILPIEGNGGAHVILRKIVISAEVDLGEKVGSDGIKHWTISDWKHSYELKDKATIELQNLFNGNELLAAAARELISVSGNEIVKEVGPPIVKAVVHRIVKDINHLFENVPAEDLEILS